MPHELLAQEMQFWIREALEWRALRAASYAEHDFTTYIRANSGFEFARRRYDRVVRELEAVLN